MTYSLSICSCTLHFALPNSAIFIIFVCRLSVVCVSVTRVSNKTAKATGSRCFRLKVQRNNMVNLTAKFERFPSIGDKQEWGAF